MKQGKIGKFMLILLFIFCTGCNKVEEPIKEDTINKNYIQDELKSITNTKEIIIEDIFNEKTYIINDEEKINEILTYIKTAYKRNDDEVIPSIRVHYKITFKNETKETLNEIKMYTPSSSLNMILINNENIYYIDDLEEIIKEMR